MTKKDYILIAGALRAAAQQIPGADPTSLKYVAERLADALTRDNPRFDRMRFIRACEKD